jgi:REP element-mobilizing transposase RayT
MARPTRLDVEGGWYHVVNRGIEKRVIFRGVSGYEHFVELLAKLPQRFGLRVHGYVLMPNHYHLQIETPQANLSRAVQWLNVSYSVWFNRKYQRVGPLFQGRFKAGPDWVCSLVPELDIASQGESIGEAVRNLKKAARADWPDLASDSGVKDFNSKESQFFDRN